MKYLALIGASFAALTVGTPAQASCFFNKAICQAICNADCCDAGGFTTPSDPEALRGISVEDLKAEAGRVRTTSRSSPFMNAVNAEIKARATAPGAGGGAKISN